MATSELRFLEGQSALKERIQALSGRRPNAEQVAFASSCLLHGRLFWESAKSAPMETKPLLLYYGAAAFCKLLVIAATAGKVSDLGASHGASCRAGPSDTVGSFTVFANGDGLFQGFNDVAAKLCRLKYLDNFGYKIFSTPAASSEELGTFKISLQEILSRVPEQDVAVMYRRCAGRPSNTLRLFIQAPIRTETDFRIRVDVPEGFADEAGLLAHLSRLRTQAPFLERWRLLSSQHAWDQSTTYFINREGAGSSEELYGQFDSEQRSFAANIPSGLPQFDAFASFPSLAGGYSGFCSYLAPIDGRSVCEHSLQLLGLLALSSLVRYRPHVWTSCVHRRPISGKPIDDSLLPVIETFLHTTEEAFPKLVADVLLAR
jgi:hypothetical protein